jgi:hypothetical protein
MHAGRGPRRCPRGPSDTALANHRAPHPLPRSSNAGWERSRRRPPGSRRSSRRFSAAIRSRGGGGSGGRRRCPGGPAPAERSGPGVVGPSGRLVVPRPRAAIRNALPAAAAPWATSAPPSPSLRMPKPHPSVAGTRLGTASLSSRQVGVRFRACGHRKTCRTSVPCLWRSQAAREWTPRPGRCRSRSGGAVGLEAAFDPEAAGFSSGAWGRRPMSYPVTRSGSPPRVADIPPNFVLRCASPHPRSHQRAGAWAGRSMDPHPACPRLPPIVTILRAASHRRNVSLWGLTRRDARG